jgi:hypothetical protein
MNITMADPPFYILTNSPITEPEDSTPLITESATGHDPEPVQSTPIFTKHFPKLHFNDNLHSPQCFMLKFTKKAPRQKPVQITYVPILATWPAHRSLLYLTGRITGGDLYKPQSSLLM